MKRHFILFSCIILTLSLYGQKNNLSKTPLGIPTEKELQEEAKNHQCVRKSNASFSSRLKHYPFNKTTQIKLVSFLGGFRNDKGLPIENDTICFSKLLEISTLTVPKIDTLTDIIFNFGYRGTTHIGTIPGCFNPRNAILFIDSSQTVFEYVEVCFECHAVQGSSENIYLGEMCDNKMNMLKAFFKNSGITYGVTKNVETPTK